MLDRHRILRAFQRALSEINELKAASPDRIIRPRSIGLRAHAAYCESLNPGEKAPSSETFRKFATGQLAFPEIVSLLSEAGINPNLPARLDRERLRFVFEEAIRKLEHRILKGQAKPRQIIRRAYQLYTEGVVEEARVPSRRTFEWLAYGKAGDPEIATLIRTAIRKKDE